MSQTLEAIFDGEVLRPDEPLDLEPNTRVRITIEPEAGAEKKSKSFLDTALSLKLEGPPDWSENLDDNANGSLVRAVQEPPDWSENLDDYLYGGEKRREE